MHLEMSRLVTKAAPPRGLGRHVLHPGVLPDRGLRDSELPRDRRDRLAAPRPFAYILYLVHADHSSLALLTSQTEATTLSGRLRMVGVPMLKPEGFSCSEPKLSGAQTRNFEAIKHKSSDARSSWASRRTSPTASSSLACELLGLAGRPVRPARGYGPQTHRYASR